MVYTVKIEPRPDQEKRDAEDREYRQQQLNLSRQLNRISAIGGGIAFLALVALIFNGFLIHNANRISKMASDLAYRPYVGVDVTSLTHLYRDANGHATNSTRAQANTAIFGADVKNFGPVPGGHYVGSWRVFLGGEELPISAKVPDTPFTIFPGQTLHFEGILGTPHYLSIMSGEKQLVIEITVEYDGPSGHYKECNKRQFAPNTSEFMNLGACGSH